MKSNEPQRVLTASKLSGNRVRNLQGEELGTIEELMVDLSNGRMAYGVISVGGFLGMGETLFAVPWDALKLTDDGSEFILDVDKDKLKQAPSFEKNNWPDMTATEWGKIIHLYYGCTPYWEETDTSRRKAA